MSAILAERLKTKEPKYDKLLTQKRQGVFLFALSFLCCKNGIFMLLWGIVLAWNYFIFLHKTFGKVRRISVSDHVHYFRNGKPFL